MRFAVWLLALLVFGSFRKVSAQQACVNQSAPFSQSAECDDNQPCTFDFCNPQLLCEHTALPVGTPCDNGVFCDGPDVCGSTGVCASRGSGVPCSSTELDFCAQRCDEASRSCKRPDGTACNDNNWCTTSDTCREGFCVGVGSPCPSSALFCANQCNNFTQTCNRVSGDVCDDGLNCTIHDVCDGAGSCSGTPKCRPSPDGAGSVCSESMGCSFVAGNSCNVSLPCALPMGTLNANGICVPIPSLASCDDSAPCTFGDTCRADFSCSGTFDFSNSSCRSPTVCDSSSCNDGNPCTVDTCVGGNCSHTPVSGVPCNDGVFCNGADTCSSGTCSIHAGDPCANNGACNNTCSEITGLCTAPNFSPCPSDAIFCNGPEWCVNATCVSRGNPCTGSSRCNNECKETSKTCFSLNGTLADDGIFCNGRDYCDGAGTIVHAGSPCFGHTDICQRGCNEERSECRSATGLACDDQLFCNGQDFCANGQCAHSGNECNLTSTCCVTQDKVCARLSEVRCSPIGVTSSTNLLSSSTTGGSAQTASDEDTGAALDTISVILIIIGAVVLLICVVAVVAFLLRKRTNHSSESETGSESGPRETRLAKLARSSGADLAQLKAGDANKRGEIDIEDQVGEGAFGEVYSGIQHTEEGDVKVALKRLKDDSVLHEFITEGETLKGLDHENIVSYFGVYVSAAGDSWLVLDFCSRGSIIQLVQDKDVRVKYRLGHDLGTQILQSLTLGFAHGMAYLESKNVIHRDLAGRNVLVDEPTTGQFVAKVGDLGLARHAADFYQASSNEFAVKWAAPEVIEMKKFSSKSDVFSFAVTCYEIWTLGTQPWKGLSNEDAGQKVLDGDRVEFPERIARDQFTECMQKCMAEDPDDRPTFAEIIEILDA